MIKKITPHEPEEDLLSAEDALQDAEESEKRWHEWEMKHLLKPVLIELSQNEYLVLENLAQPQGKTVPQLIQSLLKNILSTLIPSAQTFKNLKKA